MADNIQEFKKRYNTYDDLFRFCQGNEFLEAFWDDIHTATELFGFYLPECLIPCVRDLYDDTMAEEVENYANSVKDDSVEYYYCDEDWRDDNFFDITIRAIDGDQTFLQELKNKIAEKAEQLGIFPDELKIPDDFEWKLLFENV